MPLTDLSLEPLLNARMVKSPAGVTTNRLVSLVNGVATAVTPTAGVSSMWIYNGTGENLRFDGSGS